MLTPKLLPLLALSLAAAIPGFEQHHIAIGDAELSYLTRSAAGPVLVLIPGSFVGADDLAGIANALSPRLSILIVELRGHGASWPPPENGSIESLANDVLAVLAKAGLSRYYIGGHSIGGMIAIEIAGRGLDAVLGLIAIEGWTHHTAQRDAFGGRADTLSAELQERNRQLRAPVLSRWRRDQITSFGSIWRQWNGEEILRQTQAPVLELWGDRGAPRPTRAQLRIPDRPNIEIHWFAGASHYLPLQRPREVADAINRFIDRTSPPNSP